ncbi:MAG: two-component regulator propeller domain-containing protein [Bacteroidia bacterium]
MVKPLNFIFFGVLFFLTNSLLHAQAYQIKNYSVDNGITQPYVYSINQGKKGYLYIGTGNGICKYDGIGFKTYETQDGLAENFVTTSYEDNLHNIWFGHMEGNITYFDGKTFKAFAIDKFSTSPITSIIGDKNGYVWCATQNSGIFRFNKDFQVDTFKTIFNQKSIFSLNILKDKLFVGTDNGILVYALNGNNQIPSFISTISVIPETKIQRIVHKKNSTDFWVGTEDEGLFLLNTSSKKYTAKPIGDNLPVALSNIQDVYEDTQSNLWLATFGEGVVKLILNSHTFVYDEYQQISETNGLGNRYTKTVYADHEGNIWVGTYGTGLVELTDNFFTPYLSSITNTTFNVSAILITNKTNWFGVDEGLIKVDASQNWEQYNKKHNFIDAKITALFLADTNHLIIGTEKQGLYELNIKKGSFSKINLESDFLCNSINCITGNKTIIWVATKNGVFKLQHNGKIIAHYTTQEGLTHNNINNIYLDESNTLWVSAHSNYLTSITEKGEIKNKKVYKGADLINITSVIKDKKNNFWIATMGNGVFKMENNTDTLETFNVKNGLKSNYCYSLIEDGANNIWIGHQMGLSRIKPESNTINIFDKEEGITGDANFNAFYRDAKGNAWFGTTKGVIIFDPHKDKKNLNAPIINITSLKMNDKSIDFSNDIKLPYDDYKLRIDFIGLSFKANSHITYQYKLEGYDVDWSDKTEVNFAQYGKLTEGDYTFLLKAYNSDGVSNEKPYTINIEIAPPIWKNIWFILLIVIIIGYAIYLLFKIRESNHRKFQAELQKALNEKTAEVIFQKEEIEKKNKDITDSIRYAKRIQDAILPDVEKLKRIFPASFIFFQPRDIVSGDFYWFEQYGDRLVIVCADATGHGVPGALMSMIGNTLLKDIASRPDVTSPANTLKKLDKEIRELLKQEDDEVDHTHDSIDVIICEINIKTRILRMCSTRRHLFISTNGQLVTFKRDSSDTKGYENRDIQLNKGDKIYMFTDGYADQFGGEKSKKIKVSNIKLMLEEIIPLPMIEQAIRVDSYFNRWKEGHEQVDDVLFIGIELS